MSLEYNEIFPGLILGSLDGLYSKSLLQDFPEINTIISAAPESETPLPNKYLLSSKYNKFRYPISSANTIETTREMLGQIADKINECVENGDCVYVHCYEGVSRSAAGIITYLAKYVGMSKIESYIMVKNKRSNVCLNEMMLTACDLGIYSPNLLT